MMKRRRAAADAYAARSPGADGGRCGRCRLVSGLWWKAQQKILMMLVSLVSGCNMRQLMLMMLAGLWLVLAHAAADDS